MLSYKSTNESGTFVDVVIWVFVAIDNGPKVLCKKQYKEL